LLKGVRVNIMLREKDRNKKEEIRREKEEREKK
jgi:hypothetical protein